MNEKKKIFEIDLFLRFCRQIGLNPENEEDRKVIVESESINAYRLKFNTRACKIKNVFLSGCMDMIINNFSAGLTLTISHEGGIDFPIFKIEKGVPNPSPEEASKNIQGLNDEIPLLIELGLEKKVLLQSLGFSDQCHSMLFLFEENFHKFLRNSSLLDLDKYLFIDTYKPTVVIILDTDICCSGQFLTIIGGDRFNKNGIESYPIDKHTKDRITNYHTAASNSLSWNGFFLKNVTPLHLLFNRKEGECDNIEKVLSVHLLHLCIIYTANRSILEGKKFKASFASSESTIYLSLENENNIHDNAHMLSQLAIWPYSGNENDRLAIFQTTVAREIKNDDPLENYKVFCSSLNHLLGETRWHYRIFIEKEVDKHFDQVQKMTDYMANVAKDVSQTIESLVKGFTDTLLASVGVIVLSVIASLIKKDAKTSIFQAAMWGYAAYLFLFHGLYRLGSIIHNYYLLNKGSDERMNVYIRQLGREKVEKCKANLNSRKKQFKTWLWITIIITVLLIALIIILGIEIPKYLK